jgi:MerR family transcriptional regulator, light-induced transcriptional regulator
LDRTARRRSSSAAKPHPHSAEGNDAQSVLSIGALSRATGVPVETLRTWERRYGFPAPIERIDSGHRRYPLESVERLRLVVQALGLGHKPSIVLPASSTALHELLSLGDIGPPRRMRAVARAQGGTFAERCLDCIKRLDGEGLVQQLDRAFGDLGAMEFLSDCLGPFLHALGESWERGSVEVGHEHFASEHVREFLSAHWRPLSARADGPGVVCATLTGEQHVLGLHMAAMALSLAGARVIFLGANTPVEDVVSAVREQGANAVALSAAMGATRKGLERDVKTLVRALPRDVPVVVGGHGFERPPPGVKRLARLADLTTFTRALAARAG